MTRKQTRTEKARRRKQTRESSICWICRGFDGMPTIITQDTRWAAARSVSFDVFLLDIRENSPETQKHKNKNDNKLCKCVHRSENTTRPETKNLKQRTKQDETRNQGRRRRDKNGGLKRPQTRAFIARKSTKVALVVDTTARNKITYRGGSREGEEPRETRYSEAGLMLNAQRAAQQGRAPAWSALT